jgi:hypothetical protein
MDSVEAAVAGPLSVYAHSALRVRPCSRRRRGAQATEAGEIEPRVGRLPIRQFHFVDFRAEIDFEFSCDGSLGIAEKGSELVFLSPPENRKTVRKQESGELEVLDGPAIGGPEQVGGYYIIEADSLDEAVDWARRGRWLVGSNEVRQIFSAPG